MNRKIYITQNRKIRSTKLPGIDPIKEEFRLNKIIEDAHASDDPLAWKSESKALLQLGHLYRWTGRTDEGHAYMEQSAKLCRNNTFASVVGV